MYFNDMLQFGIASASQLALVSVAVYFLLIDTTLSWDRRDDVVGIIIGAETSNAIFFFSPAWLMLGGGVCLLPVHAMLWLWRNTQQKKVAESSLSPHNASTRLSIKTRPLVKGGGDKKDTAFGAADEHVKTMPTLESNSKDTHMKVDTTAGALPTTKAGTRQKDCDSLGETDSCENKESYQPCEEAAARWKEVEETKRTETTRHQVNMHCCGGRAETEGSQREPKTCIEKKVSVFLKWSISIFVHVLVLFVAIVKIGAARQMAAVRAHLSSALQVMYPPEYNTGPVCAWSNPTSSGIIQTFATAQDAYNANYTIVHCGECGACSNWNDLSILWTTRSNLSIMAQEW